ncbi:MAG TPA: class II aldolase/adducin family protein [Alphaproteobacteria bacterium]|nr:class II aldolase/adducin family protein [Alphaproteobacteria bacterium]
MTEIARRNDIEQLEADLRIASEILEWETGDIYGHVGVRLPGGEGIACKAFRPASTAEADWLVHFDFDANKIGGNGGRPREWSIYTEILTLRPDVQAIAHCHAPACVALSLADREIMPIHLQSARFRGPVPVYPRPIHIKNREEGRELAAALGDENAVVIKGHGIVTAGKTIDRACIDAVYMERTAKIQGLAHALGFTAPSQDFLDDMMESGRQLGDQPGAREYLAARGGYSNEWSYYKHRILKGERWTRGWS